MEDSAPLVRGSSCFETLGDFASRSRNSRGRPLRGSTRAKAIIASILLLGAGRGRAQTPSVLARAVSLEISRDVTQSDAQLHWKITNSLDVAAYVYDFYLWGPAYSLVRVGDRVRIDTTPVIEQRSCPPNRFPPVLLLVIGPRRTVTGDFSDSEIKGLEGKQVSLRIAVGSDPYSVVAEAKRFMSSRCQHSPYDAIVRWGTIIESNSFLFR